MKEEELKYMLYLLDGLNEQLFEVSFCIVQVFLK